MNIKKFFKIVGLSVSVAALVSACMFTNPYAANMRNSLDSNDNEETVTPELKMIPTYAAAFLTDTVKDYKIPEVLLIF